MVVNKRKNRGENFMLQLLEGVPISTTCNTLPHTHQQAITTNPIVKEKKIRVS